MSQRMTTEEFRKLTGQKPKAGKSFALRDSAPKKKHRSAAEWLAIYRSTPPRPADSPSLDRQRALFESHDPIIYRLWLPLAPSNNALKQIRRTSRKAWLAPTAAAESYPVAVAEVWDRMWNGAPPKPLACRVRILITVHPPREGSDIFNREKALSDSLTACGVWTDDKQIDDGRVLRGKIIPETGAMDVIVETIS